MSDKVKRTFQYTVWYRPTKKEDHKRITEVLTVDANDERHVERIAMAKLPDEWRDEDKLEYISVEGIVPFR